MKFYFPRAIVACGILLTGYAASLHAQQCSVTPKLADLGSTLRLSCNAEVATAKWNERTVRLFVQADGSYLGLMPVSVKDSPGTAEIEFRTSQEKTLTSVSITIRKTKFPTQNVKLSKEIESLRSTPEEIQLLTNFKEGVSDIRFWKDPLNPPAPGCMTSPFGVQRLHNGKPTGEFHGGIDQRTPEGEPLRAIAAGVVKFAQKFNVLGNAVGIDHGQGLESMYLHMSKLVAEPGSHVNTGDVIGYAGSTGRSTGPHLHWVLYANSVNVNPAQWIKLSPCAATKPAPSRKSSRR